jgi:hypothetical protein
MKKKETLKQLLDRLDNQSGMYSAHLDQANRLFESSVKKLEKFLLAEKTELESTLKMVRRVLNKRKKTK